MGPTLEPKISIDGKGVTKEQRNYLAAKNSERQREMDYMQNYLQIKIDGMTRGGFEIEPAQKGKVRCKTVLSSVTSPNEFNRMFPADFRQFLQQTRETILKETILTSDRNVVTTPKREGLSREETVVGMKKQMVENEEM